MLVIFQSSTAARQPQVSLGEINHLQFKKSAGSLNMTQIWQSLQKYFKHPNGF